MTVHPYRFVAALRCSPGQVFNIWLHEQSLVHTGLCGTGSQSRETIQDALGKHAPNKSDFSRLGTPVSATVSRLPVLLAFYDNTVTVGEYHSIF